MPHTSAASFVCLVYSDYIKLSTTNQLYLSKSFRAIGLFSAAESFAWQPEQWHILRFCSATLDLHNPLNGKLASTSQAVSESLPDQHYLPCSQLFPRDLRPFALIRSKKPYVVNDMFLRPRCTRRRQDFTFSSSIARL